MSTEYISANALTDNDLTLAIPGEIESVRQRLIEAVQLLGYKVLGEQPLHAKRGKQGAASYDCSVNALDAPTIVTISLKQTNDVAVIATFNYEIKSCMHMTKGDQQTLAREAEALGAMATERLAVSACRACGTKIVDESHFCRRCGAPIVLDLPELEVLRLTRGARNSYHNVFVGLLGLCLAVLTALPIFIVNGEKISGPLFWVGIPLAGYGLYLLLRGMWDLHRTLNPKALKKTWTSSKVGFSLATTALPPKPMSASITEGTTELLIPNAQGRAPEVIRRKTANTAEIDTDRLM